MHQDIEADKSRTLLKLIALIIKNIYKKHALPLAASSANAKEYILKNFPDCNKIFSGAQNQLADLNDNLKIKEIIKKFFTIKKFDEIQMITEKFKEELKRYEKRAKRIQT